MYDEAKLAFEEYVKNYDMNNPLIKSKYIHTYKVVELMAELSFRLNLNNEELELAQVIGLLHDIARFEQVKRFNNLSDIKTSFDHATEAGIYLFDNNHIRDFIKTNKYDSIIKAAIINHNKLEIDNSLNDKELMYTKMIRDMDKIDIYRVLSTNMEIEFDIDKVTKEVLKEFSLEHIIDISNVKSKSDVVITYLAFVFDINYNESYDILVDIDNFDLYLSTINVNENSEKIFRKLKEVCFDKINRGVDKK